jgi:hypothetical protein
MFRKVLFAILVAVGISLAASTDTLAQWHLIATMPLLRTASVAGGHDSLTMLLAGLGLMAVIARRRYH